MSVLCEAMLNAFGECLRHYKGRKIKGLPTLARVTTIFMAIRYLGYDVEIVVHKRRVQQGSPVKWRLEK